MKRGWKPYVQIWPKVKENIFENNLTLLISIVTTRINESQETHHLFLNFRHPQNLEAKTKSHKELEKRSKIRNLPLNCETFIETAVIESVNKSPMWTTNKNKTK